MANPSIFRAYDIRGIYGKDLDETDAKLIGKAFATLIKPKKVVVGRDNRLSSPSLAGSLISGLIESGVDVIDVGTVPSPVINFAVIKFSADGGIIVTASHLQKQYNGFKLCRRSVMPLAGDEIHEISNIIEQGKIAKTKANGKASKKNILEEYEKEVSGKINIRRKMKVVVDTGNGTAGPVIEKIFRKIGVDALCLFKEMDGNFPNHHPDPINEDNLKQIKKAMAEKKFDMGIVIDGDGDRVVFLDEEANTIRGDKILALLARDVLRRKKKAKIFTEVRGSRLLEEDVKANGGILVMGRIGHSFIKKQMHEDDGIEIAGEVSGHFYFREIHKIDDAIFASCRMIQILSDSGSRLSEMVDSLPKYFSTPELRLSTTEELKLHAVDELKAEFKKMANDKKNRIVKIIDIDGIRVEFDDGWGLFRISNTEPVLSMRFEAKTEKRMKGIEKMFMEKVGKYLKK